MKSQPQNTEFRNNPENFPPLYYVLIRSISILFKTEKINSLIFLIVLGLPGPEIGKTSPVFETSLSIPVLSHLFLLVS